MGGAVLCYDCRTIHRGTGSVAGRAVGARHVSWPQITHQACAPDRSCCLEPLCPDLGLFGGRFVTAVVCRRHDDDRFMAQNSSLDVDAVITRHA